jgi:hypothetical protein
LFAYDSTCLKARRLIVGQAEESMQTTNLQDVASARRQTDAAQCPDIAASGAAPPSALPRKPWTLPQEGLAVFHGAGDTARLSHYFLPRLLLAGKCVLFLDGANCADPRLLERLARERGVAFQEFSRRMQIARAFTCFQLTELIARVPRFLKDFPAQAIIITALPDLYFDEDVRDWNARVAFEQALGDLRRYCHGDRRSQAPPGQAPTAATVQPPRSIGVAIFSSAASFTPLAPRRRFFAMTCAAAKEVWEFRPQADGRPQLTRGGTPLPAFS